LLILRRIDTGIEGDAYAGSQDRHIGHAVLGEQGHREVGRCIGTPSQPRWRYWKSSRRNEDGQ
jgi:hypothetical protein